MLPKSKYAPLLITIVLSLLALIAPWLFTGVTFWNRLDFTQTGQIGDTIGGLTSPIIGLLNAVLLYMTIKKQDDHVNSQRTERQEDIFSNRFERRMEHIRKLFDSLHIELNAKFENVPQDFTLGRFEGSSSIMVVASIFTVDEHNLDKLEIPIGQWQSYHHNLRKILFEASIALKENKSSVLSLEDKEFNYKYLINEISNLGYIVSMVEQFRDEHTITLKSLKDILDDLASLAPIINGLEKYKPN